ncbi:MAG: precorrin-6A/cobalt-precorrin-6A reductase [Pseudomonadota bacterium]
MTSAPPILVLAGARETPETVRALSGQPCCVLWADESVPVPVEADVVRAAPHALRAVLDVTHAFDTQTRRRWMRPRVPYARVQRALWQPEAGDQWTSVDTIEQAVAALPQGARVFAATGQGSGAALATHDGPVFLRQLSVHDFPAPPNCTYIFGAGPFDAAAEINLFRDLAIDVVLARNVGGPDSFPKLAAARALGLPVVLLRPPPLPDGPVLKSPADVRRWTKSL